MAKREEDDDDFADAAAYEDEVNMIMKKFGSGKASM
jgi:hypothetical protein